VFAQNVRFRAEVGRERAYHPGFTLEEDGTLTLPAFGGS